VAVTGQEHRNGLKKQTHAVADRTLAAVIVSLFGHIKRH
jgi:hypothetical protein